MTEEQVKELLALQVKACEDSVTKLLNQRGVNPYTSSLSGEEVIRAVNQTKLIEPTLNKDKEL